ncbi:MAG: metallophosphoesterase [Azonexus sp.]|nr:metallophosphoesterase [Azonexus sp.]MBP6201806.1 metallophosphoesterase [Azonexus sp.]
MTSPLNWLHISDIHFNPKNEWRDSTTRETLLEFLADIFKEDPSLTPDFIFCTGDIAFGESKALSLEKQYIQARDFFSKLLNVCAKDGVALSIDRLFVVPGNHDVNRDVINTDAQSALVSLAKEPYIHHQTINQRFENRTKEFADAMQRLHHFSQFVKDYLPHQHDDENRIFFSKKIKWNGLEIGISCFNSAWTCSGPEDDRNIWLAGQWQFNKSHKNTSKSCISIGLIHHPNDWFNLADRDFASKTIPTNFDFWLHGHSHNAWVTPGPNNVTIAAGAVGAEENDEFGVNITTLDFKKAKGVTHLFGKNKSSFGWTITPVASHAPLGKWPFDLPSRLLKIREKSNVTDENSHNKKETNISTISSNITVDKFLSKRLSDALRSFSSQPNIWILPTLNPQPEVARDSEPQPNIEVESLIRNPVDTVIKAPPQYGLTCLAHFLAKEAWGQSNPSYWLYLDAKNIKPIKVSIEQAMNAELQSTGLERSDIKCVILDSWSESEKDAFKLLNNVCEYFGDIPVICMQSLSGSLTFENNDRKANRKFRNIYLWALIRNDIRKIVTTYNDRKYLGDEDAITTRLVSDLEVLNLHRTALNCLTLLKVYEIDFDESPVNRSEMIKRVLFLLFNIDDIPTYKLRPDLKDCEYVLGYFCETLMKRGEHLFSRDQFLIETQRCCHERLIDLETQVVFDVLYANNIITSYGNFFYFKFSYWVYYFAAQRMHHSTGFASYILEEMRYSHYPELIEFYTGIDRHRDDALKILIRDLSLSSSDVKEKCGLPDGLDPYRFAQWNTSDEMRKKMEDELIEGVKESNLPAVVKDKYADRYYDRSRPYDQTIRSILTENSFTRMMHTMRAASRALRNSDYVCPDIKRQLLAEIMVCWEQASKVLFVILPILAEDGYAQFDGAAFRLSNDFSKSPEERFLQILQVIPSNIVNWTKDDLFSQKMGPLLFDQINNADLSSLSKHELILMLIEQRPREWAKHVHKYITGIQKNSFYLLDIYQGLRAQYRYGYVSPSGLSEIEHLIKVSLTKHITGDRDPGVKAIKKAKLSDDIIPERNI